MNKKKKRNKTVKAVVALLAALIVLAFQVIDIFYIHKEGSLFGGNVIARVAGIGVALVASVILRFNVKNFCFKSFHWFSEILYGIIFAAVPFALCLGTEYGMLMLKGYGNLRLNIWFPNTNDDMSIKGTLLAMGLFTLTVLLEALFKELFFRGFLITQFFGKFGLRKSNLIQAFLFTLMIVPEIAKQYISGDFRKESTLTTVFIIGCMIFTEFMSGVKWGLYYRVNGTVWMSVVDHFANHMLLQCLYITYGAMPLKWSALQAFAVQFISFCLFVPLYFKRDRLNEEMAIEVAVRRDLAGLPVDNYSSSPVRRYIENRSFEKQKENARKKHLPEPKKKITNLSELEEAVSLQDSGFFPAEPNKSEEKNIVPNEAVKEYSEEVNNQQPLQEKTVHDEARSGEPESTEKTEVSNISKLVNEYFEENFNKHTF